MINLHCFIQVKNVAIPFEEPQQTTVTPLPTPAAQQAKPAVVSKPPEAEKPPTIEPMAITRYRSSLIAKPIVIYLFYSYLINLYDFWLFLNLNGYTCLQG